MSLTVTAIYTALFSILIIPLSMQITMRRIALGNLAFGDANDENLIRKRETLRNFSEYVPLGLLLLAIYEYNIGGTLSVMIFGGLFLFSRVLHIFGLQYKASPKYFGPAMMIQHGYFLVVSIILIYNSLVS
ncbi:MAG: MAPEG family protein [Thiohalomonadales bacterium]